MMFLDLIYVKIKKKKKMESISYISINVSFIIYCIYFLPQIIHNQLKCQLSHISNGTHILMVCANILDLIYGFGFKLQWQYRVVTILALAYLVFQQWQIYRNRSKKSSKFHLVILLIITAGIILVKLDILRSDQLEKIGFISMFCYSIYWIPQIIKNIQERKATAFSVIFLLLNVLALVCDEISALIFNWPLPSVISPLLMLSLLLIMVGQYYYYKRLRMSID